LHNDFLFLFSPLVLRMISNKYITAHYRCPDLIGGVRTTTEFELSVNGTSKDLLDAISVLASQNVNLDTIATGKTDDRFVVKFLTGNEEECRRTFMKADLPFKERRVLVMDMNNRPGQWMKAAKCIVNAGVELQASYLYSVQGDRMRFVFCVDDYEKAKKVAGQIAECAAD